MYEQHNSRIMHVYTLKSCITDMYIILYNACFITSASNIYKTVNLKGEDLLEKLFELARGGKARCHVHPSPSRYVSVCPSLSLSLTHSLSPSLCLTLSLTLSVPFFHSLSDLLEKLFELACGGEARCNVPHRRR